MFDSLGHGAFYRRGKKNVFFADGTKVKNSNLQQFLPTGKVCMVVFSSFFGTTNTQFFFFFCAAIGLRSLHSTVKLILEPYFSPFASCKTDE